MKKVLTIIGILCLGLSSVLAQTVQISGTVTSADDGQPLPGVSVVVKGTTQGTVTDANGNYSFNVPDNATLLFSFVGMEAQERIVSGNRVIDVVMVIGAQSIEEVVVTAIGITRREKALGYAVTSVKSEEVLKAREANFVNSLAGKVAGVRVSSSSGTLGGSSRIIIRGANSLDGNNQPLFVVDGLPIDNSSYGSSTNNVVAGGIDPGNRAGDINPDDIENMTVLKGAAATALYGARAKNGAIIITTKKGQKGTKLSIDLNSSVRFDKVLKLPEFQNEYAQGNYGTYALKYLNGWGPKISSVQDQKFTDFLGDQVTLTAYPDNVKDFYETGETYMNSLSVAGGGESTDYRVGLTALNQTSVIPGMKYNKYTVSANVGHNFTERLTSRIAVNYYRIDSDGRPAQSSNDPNVLVSAINGIPRVLDINKVRNNYYNPNTGEQIPISSDKDANNPYWIINKNKFTSTLDRFIGNASLKYQICDWLSVSDNVGMDLYVESRRQVTRNGTYGKLTGGYSDNNYYTQVLNNDLLITAQHRFTEDLDIKATFGHNVYQRTYKRNSLDADNLTIPELYTPSNAASTSPTAAYNQKRLMGIFGDIGISYKDMLFVNVTGRNDWSSTLPINNRSYFYPSVSGSFVFSELLESKKILDFGNLRFNWAVVGSDEDPYQLDFAYTAASTYYVQYSLSGTFPHMGLLAFNVPRVLPSSNLKPQNQRSFEIGTGLKFLKNRLGVDFTYYHIKTTDQIVSIDVPISTGYFAKKLNVGAVTNQGIELLLHLVPVTTRSGFIWNLDVNFAKNKQKVTKLIEGEPDFIYNLTSGWSGLQIQAKEGDTFGLYGTGWKRNPDGEIIMNPSTGLRLTETGKCFGNIYPDWTMGINNSFSFKGINLSFLIDIRHGGVMYSGTVSGLRTSGLAIETVDHREESYIDKGVIENADGTYSPNTTPVKNMQDFWGTAATASNTEGNVFNASYVKLREVRLAYALPGKWTQAINLKKIEVGIEGRNLWIIKSHVPHIDPELNFFGPVSAGEGVEFNSVPSTRSIGINLRINF